MMENLEKPARETFDSKLDLFFDRLKMKYDSAVGGSVLMDPTQEQIHAMVSSLEPNRNFGIRGIKVYNSKTNEVVALVWPADAILHYQIAQTVRSTFKDFETTGEMVHTFEKRERPDLPQYQLEQIMLWKKAPIYTAPLE